MKLIIPLSLHLPSPCFAKISYKIKIPKRTILWWIMLDQKGAKIKRQPAGRSLDTAGFLHFFRIFCMFLLLCFLLSFIFRFRFNSFFLFASSLFCCFAFHRFSSLVIVDSRKLKLAFFSFQKNGLMQLSWVFLNPTSVVCWLSF